MACWTPSRENLLYCSVIISQRSWDSNLNLTRTAHPEKYEAQHEVVKVSILESFTSSANSTETASLLRRRISFPSFAALPRSVEEKPQIDSVVSMVSVDVESGLARDCEPEKSESAHQENRDPKNEGIGSPPEDIMLCDMGSKLAPRGFTKPPSSGK